MKLQLEAHERKYTIETEFDDLRAYEFLEIIKGLMHQMTYSEKAINKAILELAEQTNKTFKNK
jgi:hypothetical protein